MSNINKEILFLWFGDNEPKYSEYTINNFKIVNSNYKITFIKYNNDQLLNYNKTNDKILEYAINEYKKLQMFKNTNKMRLDTLSDIYRLKYTELHKCFYFDLDCFPIEKLDNFYFEYDDLPRVYQKRNILTTYKCGYDLYNNIIGHRCPDIWGIITTNYLICHPIQIYKETNLNKKLYSYSSIICNEEHKDIVENRKKSFINCEIRVGDCFCNKELTPVEHYFVRSRNELKF